MTDSTGVIGYCKALRALLWHVERVSPGLPRLDPLYPRKNSPFGCRSLLLLLRVVGPDRKRGCPSPVLRSFSVHSAVLVCRVESEEVPTPDDDGERATTRTERGGRASLGAYGPADTLEDPFSERVCVQSARSASIWRRESRELNDRSTHFFSLPNATHFFSLVLIRVCRAAVK